MIDDKNTAPPYSRPNDKPLLKKKLSSKDIESMLGSLFENKKSIDLDLVFRILFKKI